MSNKRCPLCGGLMPLFGGSDLCGDCTQRAFLIADLRVMVTEVVREQLDLAIRGAKMVLSAERCRYCRGVLIDDLCPACDA